MKKFVYPFILIFLLLISASSLFPDNLDTRRALVQIMKGINEREIAVGLEPTLWTRYDDNAKARFNPPDQDIPDNWLEGKNLYSEYLCDIKKALERLIYHFYKYTGEPPEYFRDWQKEFPDVEDYEEAVKNNWDTLKKLEWMKLRLNSPGYLKWQNGTWSWVDDPVSGKQRDVYGVLRKFFSAKILDRNESQSRVYSIPNFPLPISTVKDIKSVLFWVYQNDYFYYIYEGQEPYEWRDCILSDFYGIASFRRGDEGPPTAYPPVLSLTIHLSPSSTLPSQPPENDFWSLSVFTRYYNFWHSWIEYWKWNYRYDTEFWYEKGENAPEIHEKVEIDSGMAEGEGWKWRWEWTRKIYTTQVTLSNLTLPGYITCYFTPLPDEIDAIYADSAQKASADSYSWCINPGYLWIKHLAARIDFHYPQGTYAAGERETWLGKSCPDPAIVISSSVNLANGNLFQDFPLFSTGGNPPLSLTLYYNSLDDYSGPPGNKWTHNYNQFLEIGEEKITLKDEDGTYIIFEDADNDDIYTPQERFGEHSTLRETSTGWLLKNKEKERYYFDQAGKLVKIEDRNGNFLTLSYQENKLQKVADRAGRKIEFLYDEAGYLSEIKNAGGDSWYLTHDPAGNLISLTDPEGGVWEFSYDDEERMLSKTDPLNSRVTYTYTEKGKINSVINREGATLSIEYDEENNQAKVWDEAGYSWIYKYSRELNVWEEITNPSGYATRRAFDQTRNLTNSIDEGGNQTLYTYDEKGNLLTITDPAGNTVTYTYDEENNLLSETDAEGHTTRYEYDERGNRIKTIDSLGNETKFEYDEKGNLVKITDPAGNTTTHTYDEYGNLVETRNPQGSLTRYTYDALGNLLSITDPEGNTTTYTYDKLGRLLSTTDAEGNTTTYTYDGLGNRLTATLPDGSTTHYTYDREGRLLSATDAEGNTTQYEYDKKGNRIKTITPQGAVTSYTYDGVGNLLSVTDPEGAVTRYEYDERGNRIKTIDPEGNTTTYTYDNLGRVISITNPRGETTTYTYTPTGRISRLERADGTILTYTYDASGNLITQSTYDPSTGETSTYTYEYDSLGRKISVTDPEGGKISYEYDSLGRIVKTIDEEGGITSYTYDTRGNLTSITYPDGRAYTYTYDALGRKTSLTDPAGNTTYYTYDERGNLTSLTDPEGKTTYYTYDVLGRIITVTDPSNYTVTYTYDTQGNIIALTDPEGKTYTYTYDLSRRLTSLTDPLGNTLTYTYDSTGNLSTRIDARGHTTHYTYNQLNQLERIEYPDGTWVNYAHDSRGNLISLETSAGLKALYTYNAGNQLLQAEYPTFGLEKTYQYDKKGNRILMQDPFNLTTTYTYTTYTYDKKGNLLTLTDPELGTFSFSYDAGGKLISLQYPNQLKAFYTYTPTGKIKKITWKKGRKLIARYRYEYDNSGNRIKLESQEGTLSREITYTYDSSNRLIKAKEKIKRGCLPLMPENLGDILPAPWWGKVLTYQWAYSPSGDIISEKTTFLPYHFLRSGRMIKGRSGKIEIEGMEEIKKYLKSRYQPTLLRTYTYNDAHQLIQQERFFQAGRKTIPLPTTLYSYDAEGNLVKEEKQIKNFPLNKKTYFWDYENRLEKQARENSLWVQEMCGRLQSGTLREAGLPGRERRRGRRGEERERGRDRRKERILKSETSFLYCPKGKRVMKEEFGK
ncbi:MAG: RHS repeat protein, partial [Caldiserica bacterium]|nr:RHS repeat protein [Caldisericota bacterium]